MDDEFVDLLALHVDNNECILFKTLNIEMHFFSQSRESKVRWNSATELHSTC